MADKDKPEPGMKTQEASEDTDAIDDDWGSPESNPKASEQPTERKASTAEDEEGEEGDDEDEADDEADEDEADDEADEDEADDEADEDEADEEEEEGDEAVAEDAESGEDEEEEEDGEEDLLPDWAPWAVLIALLAIGLLGGLGVFSSAPAKDRSAADVTEATGSEKSSASDQKANKNQGATAERKKRPQPTAADQEKIEASHLLVQYKGSQRARPEITRTKEEAKKRAEEALAKARKPGADFGAIVAEYSDEPGAAKRKGRLGSFTRRRMVKPFADAAFKLKPGELSDVVETPFGYHVILRTK